MSSKQLLFSILEYVNDLKSDPSFDKESLEVAQQCLSEAFVLDATNAEQRSQLSLRPQFSLPAIFAAGLQALRQPSPQKEQEEKFEKFVSLLKSKGFFAGAEEGSSDYKLRLDSARAKFEQKYSDAAPKEAEGKKGVSAEALNEAEAFKVKGNTALGQGQTAEAAAFYTKAIELNPESAIYFTNRAVAYINLKDYQKAVADAQKAISLDSSYCKAHYRLGQANANLGKYEEAAKSYEAALRVTGSDVSMASTIEAQLKTVQAKLAKPSAPANPLAGMDFNAIMNNPAFKNMAQNMDFSQLLSNPAMMNMMSSMMGGGANPFGGGAPSPSPSPSSSSSSSSSSPSSAPSGGMPNLQNILNSPQLAALRSDPEMAAIFDDVEKNGESAIAKYLGNPAIMAKLGSALGGGLGGQ